MGGVASSQMGQPSLSRPIPALYSRSLLRDFDWPDEESCDFEVDEPDVDEPDADIPLVEPLRPDCPD